MLQALENLSLGFSVALDPAIITLALLGVLLGTAVGLLPGLGSAATISLLLPATFALDANGAIIMLAGIWYGSMYAGSTTSIMLRVPGEATTVMACLDGYEMAKHGRAGPALGMNIFASFIGGTLGVVGLMLLAPALASFALRFGPPEIFALTVLALTLVSSLGSASVVKALISAVLGLLLAMVGLDPVEAVPRLTFGSLYLQSGIALVPMVMGLFGLGAVFEMIETELNIDDRVPAPTSWLSLLPSREDWRYSAPAIGRGSIIGFFSGILPGVGSAIASFVAYGAEKRWSRRSAQFGTGVIEGVAAPEAANNAATAGNFVPMLALGIPSNVVTALLLGALLLHGINPGPLLLQQRPEMFWGVVASMYIGNAALVILNIPLIRVFVKVTEIPRSYLIVVIFIATLIGSYSLSNNTFDVFIMIAFGVLGYLMTKFNFDLAPLVLAFILAPIAERSLRQSLILSRGSGNIFFERPISAALMAGAVAMLLLALLRGWRRRA